MMKNELDQMTRLIEEFEDRVEAVDYAIHNIVTHASFKTINKKNLGSWFWLKGADMFLYSPEQLRALGYRRQDISEKIDRNYFSKKIHPDDVRAFFEHFNRLLSGTMEPDVFECRFKSKDGTYKKFVTAMHVVKHNKEGKPLVLEGEVFLKFNG